VLAVASAFDTTPAAVGMLADTEPLYFRYIGLKNQPGVVGKTSTSVALAPGMTCDVPPSPAVATPGDITSLHSAKHAIVEFRSNHLIAFLSNAFS